MDKKEKTDIENNDPIDLPFDTRKGEWVDWIYDHRRGLLVTVAIYLLLAIGIVTTKISLQTTESQHALYMDVTQLDELIEKKEQLEQQVRELQMLRELEREYYENIRNAASNVDGELNSGLQDAKGTQASSIYEEAQAVQDRMRASREAYEKGLMEAENILNNRPQPSAGSDNTPQQSKQAGKVTVSYSLPGRHATHLPVPAYQCPGEGTIVINIEADRNGKVIKATISAGTADPCLREFALKAANATRFNVDPNADSRQTGTITYEFVAQ